MTTIVTCYPTSRSDRDSIQCVAGECEVVFSSQDTIASDIFRADIYCGHAKVPIDWPRVVAQNRLRWIQSSAAGLDHCLVPAVIESDIVVSGSSGLFGDQVAEQTMALVYGLMRGLPAFFRAQQSRTFERLPVDDLRTKRTTILGFGGNGQRIARLLAPAVRSLVATDLFPDEKSLVRVVHPDETDRLLIDTDLLICTMPLTSSTMRFLDHRRMSLLPAGSYIVNVGRGQLIDETAMIELLTSGHLAGAGLDVFEQEPPAPDNPLWALPNVIMTPHVGAQTVSRSADITALFCENLRRFFGGRGLINLVDRSLETPPPSSRLPADWRESGFGN